MINLIKGKPINFLPVELTGDTDLEVFNKVLGPNIVLFDCEGAIDKIARAALELHIMSKEDKDV